MIHFILLLLTAIPSSSSCRPEGYWWPPENKKEDNYNNVKYFSPGDGWGGWSPPAGNDDWKKWIEKWGKHRTTDRPESNEWGSERGSGSGWPQHWRGYGLGIDGIPPPPWAYVPESYDKPEYCFYQPRFGRCSENVTRWGFNPTRGKCQTFFYSGCGGNDNNFMSEAGCSAACVDAAAADCEKNPAVNFDELLDPELLNSQEHE